MAYEKNGVKATDKSVSGVHCNSGILQKVFARCFASKDSPKTPSNLQPVSSFLYDKARPHASGAVSEILEKYGLQALPQPPYSPDMSPTDFDLFPELKKPLHGKGFRSIEEVSNEVIRVIRRTNIEGVLTGIKDLPKRWTAVIKHDGYYIEGL